MKFRKLGRYRHDHTLDMDIVVMKVYGQDEESALLNVAYYSRHSNAFFDTPQEDVVINSKEYPRWKEVQDGTS